MSSDGVLASIGVEYAKLVAQIHVRIVLGACALGPFAFAIAMRIQSSVPADTLFGRSVKESGFAVPLVVLGFAALWVLPIVASVVGGDIFSSEDRYATWKMVLTRSCSRSEVFAAKVATAIGFSSLAAVVVATSSVFAGATVIGIAPLVNLSGAVLSPPHALGAVTLAWVSVLPAICSFTAIAVLVSVATRSGAAGIGLPVVAALTMQLYAFVDGPRLSHVLLITSSFDTWHGLLAEPRYYRPLVYGVGVSAVYMVVCLALAYWLLQRRDIAA